MRRGWESLSEKYSVPYVQEPLCKHAFDNSGASPSATTPTPSRSAEPTDGLQLYE